MSLIAPRDALTVQRILKVNHAGEYGAIRIYRSQIAVAKLRCADVVPHLEHMLEHEIEHCRVFRDAMPARMARPCRVMSFWSLGGSLLGFVTAAMGRQAIWTCTAAVESAVHRHLDDQLHFLSDKDRELHAAILSIREEELSHLRTAEGHLDGTTTLRSALRGVISVATDMMIWLSTWGDSTRMARDLRLRAPA
jgi:ubiquinone biosynthesis monooxygenase Coq7